MSQNSSTTTTPKSPVVKMVSQVVEDRYIDRARLAQLLRSKFGKGNFRAEVRLKYLKSHC